MISAFLIGLMGSLHCAGMCGPIMLSLTRNADKRQVFAFVIYHLGRLAVYALIGVFFGLISASVQFFAFQKYFTLFIGVLVLSLFAFPKMRNRFEGWYYNSAFYQRIKSRLIGLYASRMRWLAAGVLNGFIPCGLVYLAAAGAMLAGDVGSGVTYMLAFGAGTLPLLAGVSALRRYFMPFLNRFPNITTTIALISGLILVVRGFVAESPDLTHLVQAQLMHAISACGF